MARMPVIFVSHGSPMLALEGGVWRGEAWADALRTWGRSVETRMPRPEALVVLSAHWESRGPIAMTSSSRPGIRHDFGGFPPELYRLDYPVAGHPEMARRCQALLNAGGFDAELEEQRALDHGVWVPLRAAFPEAEIPVVQVSLPVERTPERVFQLGQCLAPLRDQGCVLMASGGLVHNLARVDWQGDSEPEPWAQPFEDWIEQHLEASSGPEEVAALLLARERAPFFPQAAPTTEHFDPLYFALGAAQGDPATTVFRGWQLGSLSLRCWAWGA